jgi:hypothetical protein
VALSQVKYGKPIGGWELDVRRPFEDFPSYDNPSSGGAPIGSVIFEGMHAPFRALACPLHAMSNGSEESPLDSAQSRRARRD